MKSYVCRIVAFLSLAAALANPAAGDAPAGECQPLGLDKAALLELRADEFAIEDAQARRQFAIELLDCVGDPDAELRDKVAYEAYATLLRARQLDTDTIRILRTRLIEKMSGPAPDEAGFRRPFAALILSEVARSDRVNPLFSDQERAELLEAAGTYLRGIEDYRGFSEEEGWRHGVAHAADLLMQLALNPALDRGQLSGIRDAVASQVVPGGAHFYVYGEPGRLARPILFVAMRGAFSDEEWAEWFDGIASPAPFAEWPDVFGSQAGLAKLHNTRAFMQAIYVNASASEKAEMKSLESAALSVMRNLP